MITIKLIDLFPDEIIPIVRALRSEGLVPGTDFDWSYHPAKYDNFRYEAVNNRHVIFTFYKEEYATMFALRWT